MLEGSPRPPRMLVAGKNDDLGQTTPAVVAFQYALGVERVLIGGQGGILAPDGIGGHSPADEKVSHGFRQPVAARYDHAVEMSGLEYPGSVDAAQVCVLAEGGVCARPRDQHGSSQYDK